MPKISVLTKSTSWSVNRLFLRKIMKSMVITLVYMNFYINPWVKQMYENLLLQTRG